MISADERTSVDIREMTADDLVGVTELHQSIFPGQLITLMGRNLITRFYQQFLNDPACDALVASMNGRILGFVFGTTNKSSLFKSFYRANLTSIVMVTLIRPKIWAALLKGASARKSQLQYLLRAFSKKNKPENHAPKVADTQIPNRLMSIGVDSSCRGQGIADRLVDAFCNQLGKRGIEEVGLSVRLDNERAIRFYEKTGWLREHTTSSGIYYRRKTARTLE